MALLVSFKNLSFEVRSWTTLPRGPAFGLSQLLAFLSHWTFSFLTFNLKQDSATLPIMWMLRGQCGIPSWPSLKVVSQEIGRFKARRTEKHRAGLWQSHAEHIGYLLVTFGVSRGAVHGVPKQHKSSMKGPWSHITVSGTSACKLSSLYSSGCKPNWMRTKPKFPKRSTPNLITEFHSVFIQLDLWLERWKESNLQTEVPVWLEIWDLPKVTGRQEKSTGCWKSTQWSCSVHCCHEPPIC